MTDPLLVRNQPALRTATRRRWLVPGAILGAVAVGMLAACLALRPVAPLVGIGLVAASYLAMVIASVATRSVRRRSLALAWLMGTMALVSLGSLVVVVLLVASEGSAAGG